jgi:hypothetical protein
MMIIQKIRQWLVQTAYNKYKKHNVRIKELEKEIKTDRALIYKMSLNQLILNPSPIHHLNYCISSLDYHTKQLGLYAKLYEDLKRLR